MATDLSNRAADEQDEAETVSVMDWIEACGFQIAQRARYCPQTRALLTMEWHFDPRLPRTLEVQARKVCCGLALAYCRKEGMPEEVVHFVWGVCVRHGPALWAA